MASRGRGSESEAVAPIVIDVVNVIPSMTSHFNSLGFWSDAIKDYVNHRVTDRLLTPEFFELTTY